MQIKRTIEMPYPLGPDSSVIDSGDLIKQTNDLLLKAFVEHDETVEMTTKMQGSAFLPVTYRKLEGIAAEIAQNMGK